MRQMLKSAMFLCLLFVTTGANAQEFSDDSVLDSTNEILPITKTAKMPVLWCSAANPDRGEFYLTQLRRMKSTSPVVIGSVSGHFAQTVNARFGMHLAMNMNHCNVFRSATTASAARATAIARAKKQALVVRDPGIF